MNNKNKHQSLSSKAIRIHIVAFVLRLLTTYFFLGIKFSRL